MFHSQIMTKHPADYLLAAGPDIPVHFFAPSKLAERLKTFQNGFPGLVTFAVKANPMPEIIELLAKGGVKAFDVASPEEIDLIRRIAPQSALHYNNPVRSASEIKAGIAANVASWSVDEASELEKLVAAYKSAPNVQKSEIAVRFKLPVEGAVYNFGAKFGATEEEAVRLLVKVRDYGFTPSLTFHVGTQCTDPAAWEAYIQAAARIAKSANIDIERLNVGGGFPAERGHDQVDFGLYFNAISKALAAFDRAPKLVCEPGRAMVADAFSYAVRVKSIRAGAIYLNDGKYGGLEELMSMIVPAFTVLGLSGIKDDRSQAHIIFGPTCDSLDTLPCKLQLPENLAEGDYLIFKSTGAYLNGVTTTFNGYGARETVFVSDL